MAFLRRAKDKDPFTAIQGCLQKRDYSGALDPFKRLLDKDAKNTQVRLRYADTLVLAGSKKEAIRQYRKVADELADAGFMIRAIAINKKIIQLDPNQADVHEKLAAMNEERSKTAPPRSSLPLQMSPTGPPAEEPQVEVEVEVEGEIPPPSEPAPPPPQEPEVPEGAKPEPTVSLEESMAMEFGETPRPYATEGPPSGAEPEAPRVEEAPVSAGEEEVVEIDMGAVDLEESARTESVEFELADERVESEEETVPSFEETKEPSLERELEEEVEPAAETEAPSFDVTEEAPSFIEEPVSLAGEEPAEEEGKLELEVEEEPPEIEIIEEPGEEEPEVAFELKSEAEEMGLEVELEKEPAEEEEVEELEMEIETEPEMAANGKSPLVGLLGEDIDSLIDSIIDDVGSSVSAPPSPPPRQSTRIPLFSDLTAEEFVDVAIMLVRRSEKAGTVIVKEGDPGDSMFIVSTGEVEATREEDGSQVKLATLQDGDFFGEMAVLSGEPRTATVTTVKSTELLELSRADLQQICSRHPEVEVKLRLAYDERRMQSG